MKKESIANIGLRLELKPQIWSSDIYLQLYQRGLSYFPLFLELVVRSDYVVKFIAQDHLMRFYTYDSTSKKFYYCVPKSEKGNKWRVASWLDNKFHYFLYKYTSNT